MNTAAQFATVDAFQNLEPNALSPSGELSLEALEEVQGGVAPLVVVAAFAAGVAFGYILGSAK